MPDLAPDFTSGPLPDSQPICFPTMPLAVYRELAAHLRQAGATVELLPQTAQIFDYQQSQVGGLVVSSAPDSPDSQRQIQQILVYYSQRYGDRPGLGLLLS